MAQLILLPGKERSSFKRHPWLFAGSVGRLEGRARPGDTVEVLSDEADIDLADRYWKDPPSAHPGPIQYFPEWERLAVAERR